MSKVAAEVFDTILISDVYIDRLAGLEALAEICQFYGSFDQHFGNIFVNESIHKLIQYMAPSLNETVSHCSWRNVEFSCENLFRPIFTNFGLCFTFNAINSREIYTDE